MATLQEIKHKLENLPYKTILLIVLGFRLIGSFYSTGFHHFDEHFQIFEFLNYWTGGVSAEKLPWEFRDAVRPWIHPFFYSIPAKLELITNPFNLEVFARIISTLLGFFALTRLEKLTRGWIKNPEIEKYTPLFIYFPWFVHYIQLRTSAEAMSSACFILGFYVFLQTLKRQEKKILWGLGAGLLLGLTYAFRYQAAIMVAFLWFWNLFSGKRDIKVLASTSVGILAIIGLSIGLDTIGYGEWTFAPYNLYIGNFVEGRLEQTGEAPWYEYFRLMLLRGIPPTSIPFLVGGFAFFVKKWRHPLTWSMLPFIIFHTVIGHKELRYLFPVILLSPACTLILCDVYFEKIKQLMRSKLFRGFCKFTLYTNLLLFVIVTFRPANPSVNFYEFVWDNNIQKITFSGESPYSMVGLPIDFYQKDGLNLNKIDDVYGEIKSGKTGHYFFQKGSAIKKMKRFERCELVYITYPKWSLKVNIGDWVSRSRVWSLYKCQ